MIQTHSFSYTKMRAAAGLVMMLSLTLASCSLAPSAASRHKRAPEIRAPAVAAGFAPDYGVAGLTTGAKVRLVSVRAFEVWTNETGDGWKPKTVPMVAWAEARADQNGEIDIGALEVTNGTWRGADPYGLLWSGRKAGSGTIPGDLLSLLPVDSVQSGRGAVFVVDGSGVLATASITFSPPDALEVETVSTGRLNGVFVAPQGKKALPTVILLHGSEGGSMESARDLAARYAGQGFASLAINYFAWDMSGIDTLPNTNVNTPVELLDDAHAWLATRPEADVSRIGVYGHSKGAEFATLAATKYSWIKAVAACVPSDAVWEGYGIGDPRAQKPRAEVDPPSDARSSWSWAGKPVPYIALRPYLDNDATYFNNTERYERSRADDPLRAKAAEIAIEASPARFLLAGGGKDEVWASGAMATHLSKRLMDAGRQQDVTLLVFPDAGHGICGDGTYPPFVWAEASGDPRAKDPAAEGPATIQTWKATVSFFKDSL